MRWITLAALLCTANLLAADTAAPKAPSEEGFVSIFDGKTMNGWQGAVKGYIPKDGVLVCDKKSGGLLLTEKEYGDFIFRFDFKLEPGANNGVAVRAPKSGDPAYSGMEIQILDDGHEKYKGWLQPWQRHGSIYNVVPAKPGFLKPVGEWNSEEILCDGKHVKVTLNGHVIVDADLSKVTDPEVLKKHPGLKRASGFLGFCGHGDEVEFRNLRVKELKK
jgi:hypothetical protein